MCLLGASDHSEDVEWGTADFPLFHSPAGVAVAHTLMGDGVLPDPAPVMRTDDLAAVDGVSLTAPTRLD